MKRNRSPRIIMRIGPISTGGRQEHELTHRVVIVGGGFAGLYAARALKDKPVEVTLVDRRNFHLFQPLLYQVATGGLSAVDIASPLRVTLRQAKNVHTLLGEVTGFDVERHVVITGEREIPYDTLIVATGSRHHYFGNPQWEAFAPGLKTLEDAQEIRRRILSAFEAGEMEADPERRRAWLTFVIVGGGPTGVELAGALGEIANDTLQGEFRNIRPEEAQIFLVEAAPRILGTYPPDLSAKAEESLHGLGVLPLTGARVVAIDGEGVELEVVGEHRRIPTHTVLWAAGVQASALGAKLAELTGAELDRAGRVKVEPDLTLPGHPEIFVLGDLAGATTSGTPAQPAVAPVAMQHGRYAARLIVARLEGSRPRSIPLSRQREHGYNRPRGRGSRSWPVDLERLARLGDVALHPPDVSGRLPEPAAGLHSVGLPVRHLQPAGAVDHGRAGHGSRRS